MKRDDVEQLMFHAAEPLVAHAEVTAQVQAADDDRRRVDRIFNVKVGGQRGRAAQPCSHNRNQGLPHDMLRE